MRKKKEDEDLVKIRQARWLRRHRRHNISVTLKYATDRARKGDPSKKKKKKKRKKKRNVKLSRSQTGAYLSSLTKREKSTMTREHIAQNPSTFFTFSLHQKLKKNFFFKNCSFARSCRSRCRLWTRCNACALLWIVSKALTMTSGFSDTLSLTGSSTAITLCQSGTLTPWTPCCPLTLWCTSMSIALFRFSIGTFTMTTFV